MSNQEQPLCAQDTVVSDNVTSNENSKDQETENGTKMDEPEDLPSEIHIVDSNLPTATNILGNKVLEEILNEKKVALLRNPEIIKYLQERSTANK